MAGRASDLLRADHRQIETQIDRLLAIVKHPNQEMVLQVRDVFAEIRKLMVSYFHKEEKVFYPYLRATLGELNNTSTTREVAQGGAELTATGGDGLGGRRLEELIRLSKELFNVIQHHIVDEENQLLRLSDLHLSALEQNNLAATMEDLEVGPELLSGAIGWDGREKGEVQRDDK